MYQVKDGCPGCGTCLNVCPVDAIVPGEGLGMVINDNCIDCGVCAGSCPINLIEAAPPVKAPAVMEAANDLIPDQKKKGKGGAVDAETDSRI